MTLIFRTNYIIIVQNTHTHTDAGKERVRTPRCLFPSNRRVKLCIRGEKEKEKEEEEEEEAPASVSCRIPSLLATVVELLGKHCAMFCAFPLSFALLPPSLSSSLSLHPVFSAGRLPAYVATAMLWDSQPDVLCHCSAGAPS